MAPLAVSEQVSTSSLTRGALIFLLLLLAISVSGCGNDTPAQQGATELRSNRKLEGRWLRPDGGYILELKQVRADGTLEAAYYNPRPIHVSSVTMEPDPPKDFLVVRFQDAGYPGSYYRLEYDETRDVLIGVYYQALQKAYYDVIFVREP